MTKFVNDYEPSFLGAEGWDYDSNFCADKPPFYAYTDEGAIIVDAGGISYYSFEETDDLGNMRGWCNEKPIETFTSAKNIVDTLEALNLDEFAEYIKLTFTRII